MNFVKGEAYNVVLNHDHWGGAVHDGDTIYVKDAVTGTPYPDIRIAGMDAPEAPRWNGSNGDPTGQPLNKEATDYMKAKLSAVDVFQIEYVGKDFSGKREVFKLWVNGRNVAKDAVYDGIAFTDEPGSWNGGTPEFQTELEQAKAAHRGMWSQESIQEHGEPLPPWEYRHLARAGEFQRHFIFHAVNAVTRIEIPADNYTIFANGKKQYSVDISKYEQPPVDVKITADGYEPLSLTITTKMDDSKPIEIELRPKGSAAGIAIVQFVPADQAVNIDCVLNSDPPQNKTAGETVAFEGLTQGHTYTLTYTPPKHKAGTKQFIFNEGMGHVVIQLGGDGQQPQVTGKSKKDDPVPVSDDFNGYPVDDNPYDNSSYEGYYTSAQCRVYIGNLFLDELNTIQYTLGANMVPLYGYADRDAAAYAQGRALVQGQLILNYVADWYLYTALRNYGKRLTAEIEDKEYQKLKAQFDSAKNTPPILTTDGGNVTLDTNARVQAMIAAMKSLKTADKKTVRRVSQYLREQKKSLNTYNTNACYWPGVFDIVIEIGEGNNKSIRRIEKCKFVNNEQVLDQSGQPLYDAYSFVGRRLR